MKKFSFIFSCLVACAVSSLSAQVHPIQFNLGSVDVGSSRSSVVTIPLTAQGTIAKVTATTDGIENLDFINPGGSISVTCNPGNSFGAVLIPCTANIKFQPQSAGARYGSIAVWGTNGQLMGSVYLQGTGIAPLTSFQPATRTQVLSGFYNPGGLTTDDRGNVYAADLGMLGSQGYPVNPHIAGTAQIPSFPSWNPPPPPFALAIDGAGNFYVSGVKLALQANGIYSQQELYSPLSQYGVVDGGGNVYAPCPPIGPAGTCKYSLQTDGSYVQSAVSSIYTEAPAVDGSGNVYIADGAQDVNTLYKYTPPGIGYTQSTVSTDLLSPFVTAADGLGNVYVTDAYSNAYKETPQPDGSYTQTVIHSNIITRYPIAVGSTGSLYYFDSTGPGNKGLPTYGVFEDNFSVPSTLSFADTTQGKTTGAQTVTITNSGNAPLQFSEVTYPVDFPESSTGTTDCGTGTTLAPNASCTLTIKFAPVSSLNSASALLSESVTITTNTLNAPSTQQSITVTGTEINIAAATPSFSLGTGSYTGTQTVQLTSATPGAAIYYAVHGVIPNKSSTLYSGPITVSSSETIKAIAYASGLNPSPIAQATFTIVPTPASAPTFSLAGGSYGSAQTVQLATTTPGATIHYAVHGVVPTASSTLYTGPITVSSSETIKAIAIASGYSSSPIAQATYTIAKPAASAPAFALAGGIYSGTQTITLTDATPGATIYYAVHGVIPNSNSTKYTGPITVSSSETIKAIAIVDGYAGSAVAAATYTIR